MTTTRQHGWRHWASGAMLAPLLLASAPGAALAQFSWFGPREASPQEVSDTIADHGFRLVGPLYRNGRVYLADVIDRRQRRERLVISAENGEIVQRFFVDVGPERRAPVAVSRAAPRDDSFFSHLTRGWDDEPPPRPPVGLTNRDDDLPPASAPPLARPRPQPQQPRVVTRTEPPTPVTSMPLAPPSGDNAGKPEVVAVPSRAPAPAQAPATSAPPPPSGVRATSVSTDPLRIPGTRKPEESREVKDKAQAAAVPATGAKAAEKPAEPASTAAPPKPKPAADVPVAPLD